MRPIILLGASNLTYGFPLIVESLRTSLTSPAHIFAAHGHGRSYGTWSRVLVRRLPGIKGCGLWERLSKVPTDGERPLALITDVGNDLLYGADPETILSWVDECLRRLAERDAAITIAGLPVASVKRMSGPRYHATRMLFFPSGGPTWQSMQQMVDELDAGLRVLSSRYEGRFIEPQRQWYGLDPIHVRRGWKVRAWHQILSVWPIDSVTMSRPSLRRATALWRLRPELRAIRGREQLTPQPVIGEDGFQVALY